MFHVFTGQAVLNTLRLPCFVLHGVVALTALGHVDATPCASVHLEDDEETMHTAKQAQQQRIAIVCYRARGVHAGSDKPKQSDSRKRNTHMNMKKMNS